MERGFDGGNAGCFFTHEGAGRAGDLVHDGDIAGHQVGKLGEKQRRAQFRRQLFVQQLFAVVALQSLVNDQRIDIDVALAAAGSNDHIHGGAGFGIFLQAGIIKCKTGGKNAETLPVFHLALVAALGDLCRPVDLGHGMNRIWLEFFRLDNRRRRGGSRKKRHMRLAANAVTGHDADPCYHHIIVRFHRLSSFAAGPAETVTAIQQRLRTTTSCVAE